MLSIMFRCVFMLGIAASLAACNVSTSTYNDTFTSSYGLRTKGDTELKFSSPISKRKTAARRNYFIEFRARNALSYGHAFVVFGKLDRRGRVPTNSKGVLIPGKVEVAGLHPRTTSPTVFSVGHVVPVLAETGWSDGDSEEAYVLARYRINLTKAEFRKVVAIVRHHKRTSKTWHAVTASCVTFLRRIARDMNLKLPVTRHLPKQFVRQLKKRNG